MNVISFLVDGLSEHYYKAELLLFSLDKFAKVSKDQIIVQCTNRVDGEFLSFLTHNNYRYCVVEPYLDKKYCNKITQLEILLGEDCEGGVLLDVDMFVLAPLDVDDTKSVGGKIVDAPVPPLPILKKIFSEAGTYIPDLADPDWVLDNAKTIETNFNGGFYYIPRGQIAEIYRLWKKWAEWLFLKPDLFENQKQRNHIDQISMALSLAESGISYKQLTSNMNFPIHYDIPLRSFQPQKVISVLHYHSLITPFGLLDETQISNNEYAVAAIRKANKAISSKKDFYFFELYKKSSLKKLEKTKTSKNFGKELRILAAKVPKRLKLVLHAGTPKTGTTSLQFYLDGKRNVLLESGILYPSHVSKTYAPKHQWLVRDLLASDSESLLDNMEKVLVEVNDNTHTLFISTEGIYNHWWDFPNESRCLLSELSSCFDVAVWVWFREPLSFLESFYRQNIKNPQLSTIKCYGKDLSFKEMLADAWFIRHLDYLGFIYECEHVFGDNQIKSFKYVGNTILAACEELNLPFIERKEAVRENIGLSAATIDLLRVINRYPLSIEEKKSVLPYIESLNKIVHKYSDNQLSDESDRIAIENMTALMSDKIFY